MKTLVRDHLIVLLMDTPEAAFFRECIGTFPGRRFRRVGTLGGLRRALRGVDEARIIAFCSPVIVPPEILAKYPGQCFNFHPGPPEHPGFRPSRLAVEQGVRTFGVTFHSMIAEVDAGPIHEVARFRVPEGITRTELDERTYAELVAIARTLGTRLGNLRYHFKPSGETWGDRSAP